MHLIDPSSFVCNAFDCLLLKISASLIGHFIHIITIFFFDAERIRNSWLIPWNSLLSKYFAVTSNKDGCFFSSFWLNMTTTDYCVHWKQIKRTYAWHVVCMWLCILSIFLPSWNFAHKRIFSLHHSKYLQIWTFVSLGCLCFLSWCLQHIYFMKLRCQLNIQCCECESPCAIEVNLRDLNIGACVSVCVSFHREMYVRRTYQMSTNASRFFFFLLSSFIINLMTSFGQECALTLDCILWKYRIVSVYACHYLFIFYFFAC